MAQTKLQLMMQYIQDHFREPLSLDEIAASASVSKSRALQIFQDHIQVSPIAYLISYRCARGFSALRNRKTHFLHCGRNRFF